jgi:hypothetical protein
MICHAQTHSLTQYIRLLELHHAPCMCFCSCASFGHAMPDSVGLLEPRRGMPDSVYVGQCLTHPLLEHASGGLTSSRWLDPSSQQNRSL